MNEVLLKNEAFLREESQSFSVPILLLTPPLKTPILCQYNLNKLLDIIEDSTDLNPDEKCGRLDAFLVSLSRAQPDEPLLKSILALPGEETKKFHYYPWVMTLYNRLDDHEKALCLHYCTAMKDGMKKYLHKSIHDVAAMNDYCYYSAGIVGEFLTSLLFYSYQLSGGMEELMASSRHVGLLLQKTNNLRDYYEDTFILKKNRWPESITASHSPLQSLNILCKDALVNDALPAIRYLEALPYSDSPFENFVRFALYLSISHLLQMIDNPDVLKETKFKPSSSYVFSLYKKISRKSREDCTRELYSYCQRGMEKFAALNL
ncbi:squalene/phytoene synthase family protein [Legionella taurinensis]|uniref:Squalene/phytoene synthase family protein n=1 Tax=Legionella taurinensis TaxID=70611 RepID=A0A3A5L147_9GAMM|nr:squalene/phytoene synthase family protein [Legionella taurinensis]RJT43923.1 hypothetical protein D6J04_13615 [Legionella taurinensis]RJT65288.1 hypothetical protein D6J03_12935 [Legionella taurinensis]STY26215.1 squalene and phytoene synthase [Legionella taurinensis]